MAEQSNILSLYSYSAHGFNQATPLLSSLCNSKDTFNSSSCIFLQELWLTPDNMYKIDKFSDNYMFYGISAMEHKVSTSVLIGRPSGGVGVLVKNSLAKLIRYNETCERFICIVIGKTIL